MEERAIRITLAKHDDTGLLAATSDDLHGLVVFGKTVEEIERKLPIAIKELLEASNEEVGSVVVVPDDRISRAGFGPPAFVANALLVKHNDRRRL
jgi:predicted RNase H-like HicB family nuclease